MASIQRFASSREGPHTGQRDRVKTISQWGKELQALETDNCGSGWLPEKRLRNQVNQVGAMETHW